MQLDGVAVTFVAKVQAIYCAICALHCCAHLARVDKDTSMSVINVGVFSCALGTSGNAENNLPNVKEGVKGKRRNVRWNKLEHH